MISSTQNDAAALDIENVTIAYGPKKVIDGLSLRVAPGETFGLIGLNGVGKTTLIKAVLGLRSVTGGNITVGGYAKNDPRTRKHLAFLPERFEPPWFLLGNEFLKFSMRLYNVPYEKARVYEASERLALDPAVLGTRVQTYSKGMRQKLGILATLLTGCPLMILDEPMSGLDPMARTLVKDAFKEARKEGRTIFLSSHILADMNEICDRVAVLNKERLIYNGTPEGLKEQGGEASMERAFLQLVRTDLAA